MKRLFLIATPIESTFRSEFENMFCNDTFSQKEITEIMYAHPEYVLWDLEDFTLYCNNQEIDIDGIWLTYVQIDVAENYTPNRSVWYFDLIRF